MKTFVDKGADSKDNELIKFDDELKAIDPNLGIFTNVGKIVSKV